MRPASSTSPWERICGDTVKKKKKKKRRNRALSSLVDFSRLHLQIWLTRAFCPYVQPSWRAFNPPNPFPFPLSWALSSGSSLGATQDPLNTSLLPLPHFAGQTRVGNARPLRGVWLMDGGIVVFTHLAKIGD